MGVSPKVNTIGVGVVLTDSPMGVGVDLLKVLGVAVCKRGKEESGASGEASPTPTLSWIKMFTGGGMMSVTLTDS